MKGAASCGDSKGVSELVKKLSGGSAVGKGVIRPTAYYNYEKEESGTPFGSYEDVLRHGRRSRRPSLLQRLVRPRGARCQTLVQLNLGQVTCHRTVIWSFASQH